MSRARWYCGAVAVCALLALSPRPAASDPEPPWAAGVSPSEREAALALYDAGNRLFEESQYARALAQYLDAVSHWDHPAIRYNIAVCLINLDEPVRAYEHLRAAMKHGEAPLGDNLYRQGQTYLALLRGQLAELSVGCSEPGATVTLDGGALLTCPGRATETVRPGPHQLVAAKPGFLTVTRDIRLDPGSSQSVDLELVSLDRAVRLERRWRAGTPWLVGAAGTGVAALGVPLLLLARSDFDDYDRIVARECETGCAPNEVPAAARDARERGELARAGAVGLFVAGGAGVVASVVMIFMNEPEQVSAGAEAGVTVSPVLGPDMRGVAITWPL